MLVSFAGNESCVCLCLVSEDRPQDITQHVSCMNIEASSATEERAGGFTAV